MATLHFSKVNALPGVLAPSTVYLIPNSSNVNLLDMYVSDSAGVAIRHTIKESEVHSMIITEIANVASSFNDIHVVADIAARNALSPTRNMQVLVVDATGDSTVASGAATYIYDLTGSHWVKISEQESMDVVFNWAALLDKPTSLVADIDDAVNKRHAHSNIGQLNKVGEDVGGNFTYNGNLIPTYLEAENW